MSSVRIGQKAGVLHGENLEGVIKNAISIEQYKTCTHFPCKHPFWLQMGIFDTSRRCCDDFQQRFCMSGADLCTIKIHAVANSVCKFHLQLWGITL